MTYTFVDVQGFAGGFSAGATLAGFKLVGKREQKGAFGTPLMEANRKFLGNDWYSQDSAPEEWDVVKADVVLGTPPCSGFSTMTAGYASAHGINAPINHCMADLTRYAAKVRPQMMLMESVSQAYSNGLPLMRALNEMINELTGLTYHATHVIQNNLSTGGCTNRKRYFLVLSQVPFGVERYDLKWLPTVGDAFADLVQQPLSMEPQPYVQPPTWWSASLRSPDGMVDGHLDPSSKFGNRIKDLVTGDKGVEWEVGEGEPHIMRRYVERHGDLPESWHYPTTSREYKDQGLTRAEQLRLRNWDAGGFSKPKRWDWEKPGRVINGSGPYMVWHPNGRFITQRETARLLGFPDNWVVGSAAGHSQLNSYWGKGTSVSPARWIMDWVRESLDGKPGSYVGDEIDGGGRLIDVSMDWKKVKSVSATAD